MTPPATAGGFSEERLLAPTAASQATAQVSPPGHLSRLAPEGPIRALKRGTPCSPQGLTARYVLRTPRFRRAATAGARGSHRVGGEDADQVQRGREYLADGRGQFQARTLDA